MTTLSTTAQEWLTWLEDDRGRSTNTLATYRRTMRTLPQPPETASREQIEAWWRDRSHLSNASRNNELSAVAGFYGWMVRFDHRIDNPVRRLDRLRVGDRVSRFVGSSDLDKLLANFTTDLRRAVALGAYGGLRVSEAASLRWADVDLETSRMIVRGKGDKERRVGLSFPLLDILLPNLGGNVITGRDEGYTAHRLQVKVNQAFRDQGVDATFHKLRHRYGFQAASAGVAPTSIAKAMGHATMNQTMKYIAAVDSDLDLIAEAAVRR